MKNIENSCGSEGCDARKLTLPYAEQKRYDRLIKRINSNRATMRLYIRMHEKRNDSLQVQRMAIKAVEKKA